MRIHLVLALILLSALFLPGANAAPQIRLPQSEIDLGKVEEGSVARGSFTIVNSGDAPLRIDEIKPSCGCTLVEFKAGTLIAPGKQIEVAFTIDTAGKVGEVRKAITLKSNDPNNKEFDLLVYLKVALKAHQGLDRSAIFKGKCRSCHADPGGNLEGEALFEALCAMCHGHYGLGGLARRLNDYGYVTNFTDPQFRSAISEGVADTSMPPFAKKRGGPLNETQIRSLVEYMRWWEEGYIFKANQTRREQ